jgi:hypothetical protein
MNHRFTQVEHSTLYRTLEEDVKTFTQKVYELTISISIPPLNLECVWVRNALKRIGRWLVPKMVKNGFKSSFVFSRLI